ncbi:hypothetical protein [uncultured Paludibaculum sp.]|uniref:hypothetical protein n=1 Tax=uncultured Paludibaculum sp. TaxID=1765020 RepID=UPI002AAB7DE3|nr:hypothetical protein [uncultured Paludibaculum sp.]
MPVHRMPGAKGRVYAYVEELEAWRANSASSNAVVSPASASDGESPRRQWRKWMVVVSCVLLVALASAWALRPRVHPNRCVVDGHVAIVYDADGHEAWRYEFPSVPFEADPKSTGGSDVNRVTDIDGDGRSELLFPLHHAQNSAEDDELYLFSPDGRLRWKKRFARAVRRDGGLLDGPFILRRFDLVPVPGQRQSRILVVSTHRVDSPSLVSLLDIDGRVLREYWHSGHILTTLVSDLDGNGKPEIYLGGVANGFECADLTVLDPDKFSGASAEERRREQILGVGPPVEMARVLFPRSSLNRAISTYNGTDFLMRVGESLMAGVNENMASEDKAENMYYFGPRMVLRRAVPADINRATFRRLHAQRLIPSELTDAEILSYRNIRYVTPWHD